jgi:lysophospholipase L1-like esterase
VITRPRELFAAPVFVLPFIRGLRAKGLFPSLRRCCASECIVAIGDSITAGVGDDLDRDATTENDRMRNRGFTPILSELLSCRLQRPIKVINEGLGGSTSGKQGRSGLARLASTEARHPSSRYWLIMFGTNDSKCGIPSGKDLRPGDRGYEDSFKDYMQRIITRLKRAKKTPILAKVPAIANATPDRDRLIRDYNVAIEQLVAANQLPVTPPDFYAHFQCHADQLSNGVHPNRDGYRAMAYLWCNTLMQGRVFAAAHGHRADLKPRLMVRRLWRRTGRRSAKGFSPVLKKSLIGVPVRSNASRK